MTSEQPNPNPPTDATGNRKPRPATVLVVTAQADLVSWLTLRIKRSGRRAVGAGAFADAKRALGRQRFDVVMIDAGLVDNTGYDLAEQIAQLQPAARVILLTKQLDTETTVKAMRCGVRDVLTLPVHEAELIERLDCAIDASRADQDREQRIDRLQNICRELTTSREEVSRQVDLLCNDLVNAYQDMSSQINEVAMTSEFRTLMRQELDVEELLRTMLEYLLTRTGATNAAVFLPDMDNRYNLGAYVNYDCPRETIAVLLDHLSGLICPALARETEIINFVDAGEFGEYIGADAEYLEQSQVIAYGCHHGGECLAVVVLFRHESDPFEEGIAQTLDVLREIFAEQLSRIVNVHNRAEAAWPDDAHDDIDLDYGGEWGDEFEGGGLAA